MELGPDHVISHVTKTFRALLELLVAHQALLPEGFEATWQRLQVALLCWSSGTDGLCPSLAARSCEALVHTLRLLDASETRLKISSTLAAAELEPSRACALHIPVYVLCFHIYNQFHARSCMYE
eukprot:s4004_g8.t1